MTLTDSVGSGSGSQELYGSGCLRRQWNQETLGGTWREVTISFDQISFASDSLIGQGLFGEVYKGYWHQDVAVKLLNMDHVASEHQLDAFKQEASPETPPVPMHMRTLSLSHVPQTIRFVAIS